MRDDQLRTRLLSLDNTLEAEEEDQKAVVGHRAHMSTDCASHCRCGQSLVVSETQPATD